MKKFIIFFSLFLFVLTLAACAETDEADDDRVQIGVSIVPQSTFVEAVGKDRVRTTVLVPPGMSPASYEPSPREMVELDEADLYFAIGVPTEAPNILPSIDTDRTDVVMLHEIVAETHPDREFAAGSRDPHIWLSVQRVIRMVEIIRDELIAIDPDYESEYRSNAADYISELTDLDDYIEDAVADLSVKEFIVYHPAFGYLADDYGLEMHAIEQDGKEATPEHLADMVDFARDRDIRVVFYQGEFSDAQAISFAEEIDGEAMMLEPLAANYVENLQEMIDLMVETL
ncbi:MAG: metal ABC transporter substrate-binding protein [Acholeplasmataceae bacterium]